MGLLKTAGRAYVATRVVGATHRRQQQRWAAQDAMGHQMANQHVPPVGMQPGVGQTPSPASTVEQLQQLTQLHATGALSTEQFEAAKQQVLAGG